MSLSTHEKIVLIDARGVGVNVCTFPTHLSMIEALMNSGILGGGGYYGCESHMAALSQIEKHVQLVRRQIEEDKKGEA